MSSSEPAGDSCDLFGKRVVVRPSVSQRQLPLPLAWSSASQSSGEFRLGDSNRQAVLHIHRFADWRDPASILVGPRGSGRSTLGQMFVEAGGGELVDGLAGADEDALFHAWNRAHGAGHRLLIIADDVAEVAAVRLPDLATRLSTAPIVTISSPDACLVRDLIEHLLVRRGLIPAPQLASYVAARLDRSYVAVHAAVDAIDAASLASGRQPGIRLARAALIDAGLFDATGDDEAMESS